VDSVLVSLDITDEVVNEAEAAGCQLIVAHHPVIFHPVRQMSYTDTLFRLVKKSISAVCAHTNFDAAQGGVNDILAAIFGIFAPRTFAGIGRVGALKAPATPVELAEKCAAKLGAHVRLADAGRAVNTLAVMGGSGGGLLAEALATGAECILTGEADHHDAIDAKHAGVSLLVAGHFSTEFPVTPVLADYLKKQFPAVRVALSRRDKDPFSYIP
jgi:dinuclear metal center YbgI/SA1388 family protein